MLDALFLGSIVGVGLTAWLSVSCRRLERQQDDLAGEIARLGAGDDNDVFPLDLKGGDDMRGVRRLIVRAKKLFDANRIEECRSALERAIERIDADEEQRISAALECGFEDRGDDLEGK